MFNDSAARVKLLVSTIRMNVRIAVILSITGLLQMGFLFFACALLSLFFAVLAFPCFVVGLLALPLCGAAPTFFAAAKKVGKEDSFTPPAHRRVPRSA
ncbi:MULTISPECIES: hypothetical protein [Paraburkholderia]|nr:hypothetical protein [Paraburkholderia podalyriae]